jgi:hypothetical protein
MDRENAGTRKSCIATRSAYRRCCIRPFRYTFWICWMKVVLAAVMITESHD